MAGRRVPSGLPTRPGAAPGRMIGAPANTGPTTKARSPGTARPALRDGLPELRAAASHFILTAKTIAVMEQTTPSQGDELGLEGVPYEVHPAAIPCHNGLAVLKRALQVALLAANVLLVSAWLLFGQGESIQPVSREGMPPAVGVVLWWSSPALVLIFHQTWAGTLLTGMALLLVSTVALSSIYASSSSTAAIGFFTLPGLGWLIALGLLGGEWLFRRPWL